MAVSAYAYVNARIGGMKSYLLKEDDFKNLIESRDLEDIVSQLKNTKYGQDISDTNVLSLELALKKSLFRDYLKLLKCVEGKPRDFIHNMAKKFEVESLKSIIKMNFLNIHLPEYLIPFGQIDQQLIEQLLRAKGVDELIEELRGTDYFGPLKEVNQSQKTKSNDKEGIGEKDKDLPYISSLETYYFDGVISSMKKLSKKDRSMVKKFVGFNIDMSNLLMALRLRGLDSDVEHYFIDGGDLFTLKHFNRVRFIQEIPRLAEIVPGKFTDLINEALEKYTVGSSLIYFDIVAKRQLLKESRKLFLGDRFHIGTLIAYLNLKENEIANLIKIVKTKDEFFNPKEIEDLLVLI